MKQIRLAFIKSCVINRFLLAGSDPVKHQWRMITFASAVNYIRKKAASLMFLPFPWLFYIMILILSGYLIQTKKVERVSLFWTPECLKHLFFRKRNIINLNSAYQFSKIQIFWENYRKLQRMVYSSSH